MRVYLLTRYLVGDINALLQRERSRDNATLVRIIIIATTCRKLFDNSVT